MPFLAIKKDKELTDIAFLRKAPLSNCVPSDVRQWLEEQKWSNLAIAEAIAAVEKSGWLHHEFNDPDNDAATIAKYSKEFDDRWELEKELVNEILRRLKQQNAEQGATYKTTGKGWYYLIEPFMNQNGYIDGAGWRIKETSE